MMIWRATLVFSVTLSITGCGDAGSTASRDPAVVRDAYMDSLRVMTQAEGLTLAGSMVDSVLVRGEAAGPSSGATVIAPPQQPTRLVDDKTELIRRVWGKPIYVLEVKDLKDSYAVVHRERDDGADTVFAATSALRPELLDLAVRGVGRSRADTLLAGQRARVTIGSITTRALPGGWKAKLAQAVLDLYQVPEGQAVTLTMLPANRPQ